MDILGSAAAAGLGSGTLAKLVSEAYGQSRTLASNQAQSEAGLLAGLGPAPSISREMLGSSLNFLGPLLTAYLKRKHPTMFAAGGMEPSGSFVRREEWA